MEIERRLVKGSIYGFIVGLALAIIFISDSQGGITGYPIPMREYILKLLRFSVKISLATTVFLWLKGMYWDPRKMGKSSFITDFVQR
ncbi:hypothetical protein ACP8HI_11575 [Paenibacillus sp. FA6]|uniref:hypothetical protein n=1 Tax=Paenibacillus sp. FA6 TaxID=3413029 RepID=UPI003F66027E